ncbi:hypothetical protein [Planomonospora alba]|uniref:hypothetical protein n=1 Tax=Planomonospora alba TaxID=161354 RepID=UPI0031E9F954
MAKTGGSPVLPALALALVAVLGLDGPIAWWSCVPVDPPSRTGLRRSAAAPPTCWWPG